MPTHLRDARPFGGNPPLRCGILWRGHDFSCEKS
jgi:hypothetical protein